MQKLISTTELLTFLSNGIAEVNSKSEANPREALQQLKEIKAHEYSDVGVSIDLAISELESMTKDARIAELEDALRKAVADLSQHDNAAKETYEEYLGE